MVSFFIIRAHVRIMERSDACDDYASFTRRRYIENNADISDSGIIRDLPGARQIETSLVVVQCSRSITASDEHNSLVSPLPETVADYTTSRVPRHFNTA